MRLKGIVTKSDDVLYLIGVCKDFLWNKTKLIHILFKRFILLIEDLLIVSKLHE